MPAETNAHGQRLIKASYDAPRATDPERQAAENRAIALGGHARSIKRMSDHELRVELYRRSQMPSTAPAAMLATLEILQRAFPEPIAAEVLEESYGIKVAEDGLIEVERITEANRVIIGDLPIALYHHTSSSLLSSIEKEGLRVGEMANAFNSQSGVYVTTMIAGETVNLYGRHAVRAHGGEPIAIRMRRQLSDLQPDPDDTDLEWSMGRQFVTPNVPPSDLVVSDVEGPQTNGIYETQVRGG